MNEVGIVKEVKGDTAYIVFKRKSGCGDNCGHCSGGCSQNFSIVDVKNSLGASKGDKVEVGIGEKSLYKMTALVYGFPLVMLLAGVIFGNSFFSGLGLGNPEAYAIILGLLLLAVSYSVLRSVDKKLSKDKDYSLKMIKILERN